MSSGNVARRHTPCFSEVSASTESKFEVPHGMLLAGTLDVSARSMLRHGQSLRALRDCRSTANLMFQRGQSIDRQSLRFLRECCLLEYLMLQRVQCFNTVKVWDSSGKVAHRHIWCFSEVNASTQSKFEVTLGMLLAGTPDVSARSILRHSPILTFLRECCSPAQLIFERGQSFDTVKVWGFSGNVACRHTWCFSKFYALTQSKFEVPQGMSLASTVDVSVRSMLRHSQSLRFLRKCCSQPSCKVSFGYS